MASIKISKADFAKVLKRAMKQMINTQINSGFCLPIFIHSKPRGKAEISIGSLCSSTSSFQGQNLVWWCLIEGLDYFDIAKNARAEALNEDFAHYEAHYIEELGRLQNIELV